MFSYLSPHFQRVPNNPVALLEGKESEDSISAGIETFTTEFSSTDTHDGLSISVIPHAWPDALFIGFGTKTRK